MSRRRTVAVVMAGGTGTRVGRSVPKQLIAIAGRPIIEHTIAALQASEAVDEIIVMMAPGHLDAVRAITGSGRYPKVTRVLEGAGTRNGTTRRAIEAIGDEDCDLLFHDAARPLVSQRVIADCVAALETHGAVGTAIPSADTVVRVDRAGTTVEEVLPRDLLRRVQTPQCFRSGVIRRAYDLAAQDARFQATDDCTVVLRYTPEVPVAVVAGEERNLKVTEPVDVHIAEALLQLDRHEVPTGRTGAQRPGGGAPPGGFEPP